MNSFKNRKNRTQIIIVAFIVTVAIFAVALPSEAQAFTISGVKFEDSNKDGEWQRVEALMQKWTITISGDKNAKTVTGPSGIYVFEDLSPGSYTVCREEQAYWFQTSPNGCYNVVITNSSITGLNFGDYYNPNAAVLGDSTENEIEDTSGAIADPAADDGKGKGEVLGETGVNPYAIFFLAGSFVVLGIGLAGLRKTLYARASY